MVSRERSCISSWRFTKRSSSCAYGMAKSGSVSRQRPRSRPTTCSPASASSFARIVPVRPTPTITASTGLSRVAMSVLSAREDMLRVAVLVGLGAPFEHVEDRHRLGVVGHAVLVAVAAVDRVGEEALDGVVEQEVEEEPPRYRFERELSVLQPVEHVVLLAGRELVERLSQDPVDLADRGAIDLLRRERRLVA